MNTEKLIRTMLIWLPSGMLAMIFIQNGFGKILQPDQIGKVVKNDTLFIIVGIMLLTATVLFLNNKTILWGTTILALYMTMVSFIHWSRGKPFEVAALMVACTIFAAYLRQPQLFHKKNES